eukprot:GCRY01004459.1.p1 GENE.GCRY01004459.1~~GCRY01004459.1.p1  ORF type:complete len:363 (+),score=67.66 GCRY01004459.1:149-1237(+)
MKSLILFFFVFCSLALFANCAEDFRLKEFQNECVNFTLPTTKPTNARQLHPSHINVIMALGDSITAGFGMKNVDPFDLVEFRGRVFSIGTNKDSLTLPNLIKKFNPNVVGGASGFTVPFTKGKDLDAGISGATVLDFKNEIDYLVGKLKGDYASQIDFENDWKLVTVLIGANDICDACHPEEDNQDGDPKVFLQKFREYMHYLRDSIPRLFVNVLPVLDVSSVYDAAMTSNYCKAVWKGLKFECQCLHISNETRQVMKDTTPLFNQALYTVSEEMNALNDPEFYMAMQPGVMEKVDLPSMGVKYLSKVDCFHPGVTANEYFATYLWNGMFKSPRQKPIFITLESELPSNAKLYCPTKDDVMQ